MSLTIVLTIINGTLSNPRKRFDEACELWLLKIPIIFTIIMSTIHCIQYTAYVFCVAFIATGQAIYIESSFTFIIFDYFFRKIELQCQTS